jgi:hypothetical protein
VGNAWLIDGFDSSSVDRVPGRGNGSRGAREEAKRLQDLREGSASTLLGAQEKRFYKVLRRGDTNIDG